MDYYANSSLGPWTVKHESNRPERVVKGKGRVVKKPKSDLKESSDKLKANLTEKKEGESCGKCTDCDCATNTATY